MNGLTALRAFIAVAQRQSFAEAARDMRVSATSVSRAVAELEDSLGVALLRRTTRSVSLTPEGAAYLDRCRVALDELDDAARSLRGENAEPRGALVITAPVVFGRTYILPIVSELLRAHSQLEAQLILTDRVIRLAEEGIDVAVRIAELADSALHAIQLGQVRRVLVASPSYLAQRRAPTSPAQLRDHDLIAFDGFTANGEWRFAQSGHRGIRCEARLLTNCVEAAIEAALNGLGIARALNYQVDQHVRAGRLVYLLPKFDSQPVPINLLFQSNRRSSPNVRALIAAAQTYFRSHPLN